MKTITIMSEKKDDYFIITVRPPPDWKEFRFKQFSPAQYYQEPLDWDELEGNVGQDEWLDCVCDIINRENDVVYVNNNRKCAILEFFGFKQCINKEAYPYLTSVSEDEEEECTHEEE